MPEAPLYARAFYHFHPEFGWNPYSEVASLKRWSPSFHLRRVCFCLVVVFQPDSFARQSV